MKTILVIGSNTPTQNTYLESLEQKGFDIINAENVFAALRLAQEKLPDLIICNLITPGVNGCEILTKLRQEATTAIVPVILLLAKANCSEIRKYMDLGADDYLIQPFTMEELLGAIAARLKRQDAVKQWYFTKSQPAKTLEAKTTQALFPSVPKLNQCFNFIETHYHQQITLKDVAQAVGYSPAYLTDLVKRQTGQSVYRWITKRRIAEACRLLTATNYAVYQIGEAVGYTDANHFIRQFRQFNGMTPQVWRQLHGS
ncbi:helix-turn-helix domain-containing protein [Aerosakkonemataceae cyanobacterium BLCC-F50]|uniref:Helix-turn-helix domain-containing protein n=1 Tax=Floridaenema flaviceps BLCC-F50 TaxID=3153642 RepID=A0ABV4Y0I3_9CYAN